MTADPTPTVPAGWVAVPESEVFSLKDRAVYAGWLWDNGKVRATQEPLAYEIAAIVARLPKPPAWTEEDVVRVRDVMAATADVPNMPLVEKTAEAILDTLAAAGRLKAPEAPRDH